MQELALQFLELKMLLQLLCWNFYKHYIKHSPNTRRTIQIIFGGTKALRIINRDTGSLAGISVYFSSAVLMLKIFQICNNYSTLEFVSCS